jgi:outer membrane autotransporter protein
MHGFSLSGYASWYHGTSWYMDSVLTLGWDHYRHKRLITYSLPIPSGGSVVVNQIAKASAGGSNRSLSVTFGHDFHRQAWAFSVYGRGIYSVMDFDSFREKLDNTAAGSGLALSVQSRSMTQLSSILGGKVDYVHSTDWGVLMPHLELEWQHEHRGDPENFVATFINDPSATPITVTGDAIDKSFFRVGVGLSVVMTHGRSGFVLYQRVIGKDGVSQENLTLGLRVEF